MLALGARVVLRHLERGLREREVAGGIAHAGGLDERDRLGVALLVEAEDPRGEPDGGLVRIRGEERLDHGARARDVLVGERAERGGDLVGDVALRGGTRLGAAWGVTLPLCPSTSRRRCGGASASGERTGGPRRRPSVRLGFDTARARAEQIRRCTSVLSLSKATGSARAGEREDERDGERSPIT